MGAKKIYLASSWRNPHHQEVLQALRQGGHQVYNFRCPNDQEGPFPDGEESDIGFNWRDISPEWENWAVGEFRKNLQHPTAVEGFHRDMKGLYWANTVVMLLSCGRSAHLEAGWACGWRDASMGRLDTRYPTGPRGVYALIPEKVEPELMYGMLDGVTASVSELLQLLASHYY